MRNHYVLRTGAVIALCVLGATSWAQPSRKARKTVSTAPQKSSLVSGLNEDFQDGERTYNQWTISGDEGAVAQDTNGLRIRRGAKQPPVLFTRRNPFPKQGDWSFSFIYRFKDVGENGPTVACVDSRGKAVVALFQESGEHRQVLALNGAEVWSQTIQAGWRVVSVTRAAGRLTAYVDGQQVAAREGAGAVVPNQVLIGSAIAEAPSYSTVEVQLVRVADKVAVLDRLAIRGLEKDETSFPDDKRVVQRPRVLPRPESNPDAGFPADRVAAAHYARSLYQRPTGSIGRVNGLSVIGNKGSRLPINATVTPGRGRVRLLNRAFEMAIQSAETAADYVRRRRTADVNWLASDVVFSYDTSSRLDGTSAGVANATALLSSVDGLSVDQSIAMTGGVRLDGKVDPVGLVGAKALAVLTSSDLSTLILPAKCVADLQGLWLTQPRLFLEKRIVLVDNMDQVLDYALIGRSERVSQARLIMLAGLNHYASGDFKAALDDFGKAQQYTPEDASIGLWIYQTQKKVPNTASLRP